MSAADKGQAATVTALLAAGANPAAVNHQRKSALNFAQLNGHSEVLAALQAGQDARGTSGQSAPTVSMQTPALKTKKK
jgi:ankyrin repeat protein